MNPALGNIRCPFCGNESATVHREARGRRALYLRCYDGPRGECGTAQMRGPGGQAYIEEHARWFEPVEQDAAATEAATEAAEQTREAVRSERRRARRSSPLARALAGFMEREQEGDQ